MIVKFLFKDGAFTVYSNVEYIRKNNQIINVFMKLHDWAKINNVEIKVNTVKSVTTYSDIGNEIYSEEYN